MSGPAGWHQKGTPDECKPGGRHCLQGVDDGTGYRRGHREQARAQGTGKGTGYRRGNREQARGEASRSKRRAMLAYPNLKSTTLWEQR